MDLLILDRDQVRALLPMPACIDQMALALGALARGDAIQPLRTIFWLPQRRAAMGMMPAALTGTAPALGVKVVSVFPGNHAAGLPSHQGPVLLFETEHGRPKALVDAAAITEIRTAAASGLATRVLARPEAGDLALLGSGAQARTHLQAMAAVRPLRRVRVYSPDAESTAAFARWARTESGLELGVEVEVARSAKAAVEGADLICTVSAATEPIVGLADVSGGAHVNAVGSSVPFTREIATDLMAACRLFVDRRESALAESGDVLMAQKEAGLDPDHIQAELGELVEGLKPGRTSPDEITLYESLGLGLQDLVAAEYVYARARERGVGTAVPWGTP